MKKYKILIALHILLMVYSLDGILSKLASFEAFMSFKWCLCYGGVVALLGIYAIGWQQIIKRMPLTSAYANKAVTVLWGIVWGFLFFNERVTVGKIVGALFIICGVVLFSIADGDSASDDESIIGDKEDTK